MLVYAISRYQVFLSAAQSYGPEIIDVRFRFDRCINVRLRRATATYLKVSGYAAYVVYILRLPIRRISVSVNSSGYFCVYLIRNRKVELIVHRSMDVLDAKIVRGRARDIAITVDVMITGGRIGCCVPVTVALISHDKSP